MQRDALVDYTNQLLCVNRFKDYCPNGLQVEGKAEINKIISAVTASESAIQAAIACKADVLLVHHGYFWKGEDSCITSMKRRRLALLLKHDINLLAYHLPLDVHPTLGNSTQLGNVLDFPIHKRFDMPELAGIGCVAEFAMPMTGEALSLHIAARLSRAPLHITSSGNQLIKRIAWVTGAAQDAIELAALEGCDAYLSGEVSERTYYQAKELDIHYFAAGHHATEKFGIAALGQHIAEKFDLQHRFIDIENPI